MWRRNHRLLSMPFCQFPLARRTRAQDLKTLLMDFVQSEHLATGRIALKVEMTI